MCVNKDDLTKQVYQKKTVKEDVSISVVYDDQISFTIDNNNSHSLFFINTENVLQNLC